MTTKPNQPKVGLLALTLELYESLAPGLRASREDWVRREALPRLGRNAQVLFERAVCRQTDIQATVQGYESAGADGLLVVLLTYSPSQLALPALRRTRLPIAIWNTQELHAVNAAFTTAQMIDNHGVHGSQDLANVLLREGVKFHYLTSHPSDEGGLRELEDFFAAAAAVRRLQATRIGLLGYPFPGMGDFAVDTTRMVASLGCSWTILSVEEYIKRAAAAHEQEVSSLVLEYRRAYAVAADVSENDLAQTARVELALRQMIDEHGLSALTYQFLAFGDDERTPTVPFVAASRLMAEGIGFGGEGDLIAAAGTTFLNWLSPPATFSEVFTIDFAGHSLFMSHMGEANAAMARRDVKIPLVARPTPITRTRHGQLALVTSLEPGPATFAALTICSGGRWRWIAAQANIEDYGPLPGFAVPHFKLKPAGDVRQFLTDYANAGGPHHNAVCFGDARRRLRLAAGLMDGDYREI
jgi:L-arabinose isomerase